MHSPKDSPFFKQAKQSSSPPLPPLGLTHFALNLLHHSQELGAGPLAPGALLRPVEVEGMQLEVLVDDEEEDE